MEILERARARARELLTIQHPDGSVDLWLWEHSERVMHLAHGLAQLPEYRQQGCNQEAAALAGLFSNAGWALQVREEEADPWLVLARPTNDVQRELGAVLLQEELAPFVSADVLLKAVEVIRACNDREARIVEAQIVAEAENLAEIGVIQILRQFRQQQIEGRPLAQLLDKWQRQKEYRYWEARINDCLISAAARTLAAERLAQVDQFMRAVGTEAGATDLDALLNGA
ncbi:MAG: hypothetical protein JXO22_11700 [Phycisphaerae bacterium]|nr:hypothetical protein [Phycisphaerae bacterium]